MAGRGGYIGIIDIGWVGISDAAVGFIEEERCGQYQRAINESCGYRAGCEQRKGYCLC